MVLTWDWGTTLRTAKKFYEHVIYTSQNNTMNRNFGYLIILIVIYNCTSIRLENCKVEDLAISVNKNNTNAHAGIAYICEHMWGNFF